MKKLLIIGNLLFLSVALRAQSDYFVFIQSDNNQPFYVQTGEKTLSSSAIGHLIISGLKDSLYVLNIGFPKNQFPEQSFQLKINRKDAGYQLKNMGGEGWALFNLQTLQLIKSQQSETKKPSISYGDIKRTDVFSTLMAGLVNDSAVLYTSIAKVEPKKEDSKIVVSDSQPLPNEVVRQPTTTRVDTSNGVLSENNKQQSSSIPPAIAVSERKDTALARSEVKQVDTASRIETPVAQLKGNDSVTKPVETATAPHPASIKQDSIRGVEESKRTGVVDTRPEIDTPLLKESQPVKPKALIVWLSETKTAAGTELVYYDMSEPDKTDTIRILIPNEQSATPVTPLKSGDGDEQSASQKKGNVFGKLFGRKDKASSDKKAESSITVTTVEQKKSEPVSVKESSSGGEAPSSRRDVDTVTVRSENADQRDGFFGKLFRKKDKSGEVEKVEKEEAPKTSTVTVADVESKKKPDTTVSRKTAANSGTNADPEVERLRKDQEQEEKTGTQRLFGRLFGKKGESNKTTDRATKDGASSIKVTTVEPSGAANTKQPVDVGVTNSDCRQFATSDDADKLRVRMLMEKDPDAQVVEARKTFKTRCFSTEQIKSLSTLFRTDEGKYKLFDAAYPFVSDSRNFKTLVNLLTDQYYVNRFKAMVRM